MGPFWETFHAMHSRWAVKRGIWRGIDCWLWLRSDNTTVTGRERQCKRSLFSFFDSYWPQVDLRMPGREICWDSKERNNVIRWRDVLWDMPLFLRDWGSSERDLSACRLYIISSIVDGLFRGVFRSLGRLPWKILAAQTRGFDVDRKSRGKNHRFHGASFGRMM
jgi:hypothetical protein